MPNETHKIMPYILPIASIFALVLLFIFARPQITGFFVASPQLNAEIRITANEVLPKDAIVHIFFEKNGSIAQEISISSIDEFVKNFSGQGTLQYKQGRNDEINYDGYGYIGSQIFNLKLDTGNLKGAYILKTRISYQDQLLSETQQEIVI